MAALPKGSQVTRSPGAVRRLRLLYRDVHECETCFGDPACGMLPDEERVMRQVVRRAASSAVFVIGQALGPNTQRRSGLPYMYPNGVLSATGRALDHLLQAIGYTIDATSGRPCVYSSDIVQRYPGRAAGGGGDRAPTRREVENCAEWLNTELRIVGPRVILLLGRPAARHFLESHGTAWRGAWGEAQEVTLGENHPTAFAVYHPAYRRRNPQVVDDLYARVAERIRTLLGDR
jgi:uracil-DNA glycosylase family 4